jgi:hypothetical protein
MGDHVHHLTPKEEGGNGDLDNAIFLCAWCHLTYGHNRDKRKQLRAARDDWYEIVRAMYSPADIVKLEAWATKDDVASLSKQITDLSATVVGLFNSGQISRESAANVVSTMASSITAPPAYGSFFQIDPPLPIRILIDQQKDKDK